MVQGANDCDDVAASAEGPVQRNVTIYADGAADRCPCGSGTAASGALLEAYGRLGTGQSLRHHSIVGTTFIAPVAEHRTAGGYDAVIPEVDGMAYRTGERMFVLDGGQPGTGFVLR